MGMSSGGGGGGPMAEINVTPLVDVMLVLLIIFMITAPMMSHKVKVTLPKATLDNPPENKASDRPITIAIKDNGQIYMDDAEVSIERLKGLLATEAQKTRQPRVDIRADQTTRYKLIKNVIGTAKEVGMQKVGFVSEPKRD